MFFQKLMTNLYSITFNFQFSMYNHKYLQNNSKFAQKQKSIDFYYD
jgi:hypothetical protein